MIALIALCVLTLLFLFADETRRMKITVVTVLVISILFQFVIPVPALIPTLMQLGLGVSLVAYFWSQSGGGLRYRHGGRRR